MSNDAIEAKIKKAIVDEKIRRAAKDQVDEDRRAKIEIIITPASKIKRERLEKVFGGRLIRGAFQMLVGPGEAGKGMVSTDLSSRLSNGFAFPGEHKGREPTKVLICVTEDSKERMRARLEAAGADLDNVLFAEGPPSHVGGLLMPGPVALMNDAGAMVERARKEGAGALFFETLLEHMGDREGRQSVSTNNEFDVRKAIAPASAICKEAGLIGWGVMHPRKSTEGGIEDSISGSAAFRNVSRGVLHVYKDPRANGTNPIPRLFLCSKANYLAQRPSTLRFHIIPWDNDPDEGRVQWLEGGDLVDSRSAEDVWDELAEAKKHKRERKDFAVMAAEEFLKELLSTQKGHLSANEIYVAAETAGIPKRDVERAKANLNVRSKRLGFGKDGKWVWEIVEPSEDM